MRKDKIKRTSGKKNKKNPQVTLMPILFSGLTRSLKDPVAFLITPLWCHRAKFTPPFLVLCCHFLNSSHCLVFQSHHRNNFLLSDSPFFCFSHSSLVTIWFSLQSEPESGWLVWLETGFKKTQKKAISSLWPRPLMTKPDSSAWVYPDYHSQR